MSNQKCDIAVLRGKIQNAIEVEAWECRGTVVHAHRMSCRREAAAELRLSR